MLGKSPRQLLLGFHKVATGRTGFRYEDAVIDDSACGRPIRLLERVGRKSRA